MKFFLGLLAIGTLFLWAGYLRVQHARQQAEFDNRYIYGFGVRRAPVPFANYLEKERAEGLREIRWDHKPTAIGLESSYYTTGTVMTVSSTTGAWATCTTRPAMNIVTQ